MKINGDQTAIQLDAYLKNIQAKKAQVSENQKQSSAPVGGDHVKLSGKAKAMQLAAHTLNQAETGIMKRVQQVKLEIDQGTYKVDGAKVAKDMLNESIENSQIFSKIDMHA